jgi:hypothetical protein
MNNRGTIASLQKAGRKAKKALVAVSPEASLEASPEAVIAPVVEAVRSRKRKRTVQFGCD